MEKVKNNKAPIGTLSFFVHLFGMAFITSIFALILLYLLSFTNINRSLQIAIIVIPTIAIVIIFTIFYMKYLNKREFKKQGKREKIYRKILAIFLIIISVVGIIFFIIDPSESILMRLEMIILFIILIAIAIFFLRYQIKEERKNQY